jgi:hypothetical protein
MGSPVFNAAAAQRRLQSAGLTVISIERAPGPLLSMWVAKTSGGDRWVGKGPQGKWAIFKADPQDAAPAASTTRH